MLAQLDPMLLARLALLDPQEGREGLARASRCLL
jgi:hypothetical protein